MKWIGIGIVMILSCIWMVSAESDLCTPIPNDMNVTYTNEGNWFNFTLTSPTCYVCSDNGAMYGDVDCVICGGEVVSSTDDEDGIAPEHIGFGVLAGMCLFGLYRRRRNDEEE